MWKAGKQERKGMSDWPHAKGAGGAEGVNGDFNPAGRKSATEAGIGWVVWS